MAAKVSGDMIRVGYAADAASLARLRLDLRTELSAATEDAGAFLERCSRWMTERLEARGERRPWHCWVAEGGGGIAGALWVQLLEKIPNPVGEPELHAYLTNFYVQPAARGLGLGSQMLRATIDWCRDMRVDSVILWPSAGSRSLYIRHGFEVSDDLLQLRLSA